MLAEVLDRSGRLNSSELIVEPSITFLFIEGVRSNIDCVLIQDYCASLTCDLGTYIYVFPINLDLMDFHAHKQYRSSSSSNLPNRDNSSYQCLPLECVSIVSPDYLSRSTSYISSR